MPRIDLGDDDSEDALADALRQLEKRRRGAEPKPPEEPAEPEEPKDETAAKRQFEEKREASHRKTREDIQEAVERIWEQRAAEARRPARGIPAAAKWALVGAALVAAIIAAAIFLRPTPLPPPASTPQEAVRGFWGAVIEGNYQAATVYYPALVQKYGTRRQAALFLEQVFGRDPPVRIESIGEPESLPDSDDARISYELWMRSSRPRTGEFIVREPRRDEVGCVIVTGP